MWQTLTKLTVAYMQRVWQSWAVSCAPPFLLTPTLPLSLWAIRDSPTLSSLVFVSPSRAALGHSDVIVRPLKTVAMPTCDKMSLEAEQPCDLQQDMCLSDRGVCNGKLSPANKGVGSGSPAPYQTQDSLVGCDCATGGRQLQCQLVNVPSLLYVSAWKVGGAFQCLSWWFMDHDIIMCCVT